MEKIKKNLVLIIFGYSLLILPFFTSAGTYPDSDVPMILPRSVWENTTDMVKLLEWLPEDKNGTSTADDNPNSNDAIPDYAPIERIVIHDTGCSPKSSTCNSDSIDEKAIIQSIYRDHAKTRGWGDIGYHYIVDRKGNIYEARFGGNGVRGAHIYDSKNCRNFNVGTIGITVLGNYDYSQAPEPAFVALAQLTGWLSAANEIDAGATAKTSIIWGNPKINGNPRTQRAEQSPYDGNGKCDLNYGSFSSSFTGPVILGHNEIELANSDPGKNFDMNRLRAEAKKWQDKYQPYLYQEKGSNAIMEIKGGTMKKIADSASALGASIQPKIININSSQLFLFPEENAVKLPDGSLVKSRNRPEIFLIENGKRRHIVSAALFNKFGFMLSQVKVLSDRELMGYSAGESLTYPDGTLLGIKSNGKTYFIKNGKKRHIISQKAFKQNGFKEKNIAWVPQEEIDSLQDDGIVGLPKGTLVSLSNSVKAPNYIIMDGGRELIPSWAMFDSWKFKRNKISLITKKDFEMYPDKGTLPYPDGALIAQSGKPEMYLVRTGMKYWVSNYETFKKLGLNAAKAVKLSAEELGNYPRGKEIAVAEDWQKILNPAAFAKTQYALAIPEENKTAVAQTQSTSTADLIIRVGLFEVGEKEGISITADKDFIVSSAKTATKNYKTGETATINWSESGDAKFASDGAIFTIKSHEAWNWNKTVNFNSYRGSLELTRSPKTGKIWLVNQLPFEQYLRGIGEALNSDPPEYQKAFVIASRSYAMFHLQNGGKYGKEEIFHLNNSSSDQVYKGYAWENYAPLLPEAVEATAGEVIKYNNKVARSVYSSDSGGITKNACSYFGKEFCTPDYGYLAGGVKDPEGTVRRDAASIKASHGVGMSATGARRLAQLGKNYQEVLKYYYKDITIEKIY